MYLRDHTSLLVRLDHSSTVREPMSRLHWIQQQGMEGMEGMEGDCTCRLAPEPGWVWYSPATSRHEGCWCCVSRTSYLLRRRRPSSSLQGSLDDPIAPAKTFVIAALVVLHIHNPFGLTKMRPCRPDEKSAGYCWP